MTLNFGTKKLGVKCWWNWPLVTWSQFNIYVVSIATADTTAVVVDDDVLFAVVKILCLDHKSLQQSTVCC